MKSAIPVICSLLIYFVALFLPALHGGGTGLDGLALLLFGWVQLGDGECLAWLANPLYAAACIAFLIRRFRTSLYLASAACIVGLDTFRATVFSPNEAGYNVPIEQVGSAFYVWELSFLLVLIASVFRSSANDLAEQTPRRESV